MAAEHRCAVCESKCLSGVRLGPGQVPICSASCQVRWFRKNGWRVSDAVLELADREAEQITLASARKQAQT